MQKETSLVDQLRSIAKVVHQKHEKKKADALAQRMAQEKRDEEERIRRRNKSEVAVARLIDNFSAILKRAARRGERDFRIDFDNIKYPEFTLGAALRVSEWAKQQGLSASWPGRFDTERLGTRIHGYTLTIAMPYDLNNIQTSRRLSFFL